MRTRTTLLRSRQRLRGAALSAPSSLLACTLLALTLVACDSATPETTPEAPAIKEALSLFPAHAAKGQERLPVCHLNDAGVYLRIEVAEPAYEMHLGHGDGALGGAVPGMDGYVFDDACAPVVATCPCFTAADLDGFTLSSSALFQDDFIDSGTGRATVLAQFGNLGEPIPGIEVVDGAAVGVDPATGLGVCQLVQDRSVVSEISGISAAQAEACRGLIYDEAAARSIHCEGTACGVPYTP